MLMNTTQNSNDEFQDIQFKESHKIIIFFYSQIYLHQFKNFILIKMYKILNKQLQINLQIKQNI